MLARQRKDYLLKVLQTQGQIVARDVSQELSLSEDTIRRDLRELAAAGKLQRVHGGALPSSPAVVDFAGRQQIASDAKVAIGRAAAKMIRRGQVVILDGGTTTLQIARHLPHDLHATVVTHSPTIAVALVEHLRSKSSCSAAGSSSIRLSLSVPRRWKRSRAFARISTS